MKSRQIQKLVLSGLFAAVIFTMTAFVSVPLGIGYANLGDCFVLIGGLLLGPIYGFAAAGVGSALADIILGFAIYSPATLLIKGLMAVIFALSVGKKTTLFRTCAGCVLCEAVMVGSYLVFELFLYGEGAFASVVGNLMQGLVGGIAAAVLATLLSRTGLVDRIKRRLH